MYSQTRNGKTRFFESYIDRNNMRRVVSVTMDKDTKYTRKTAQERLNARISELKGNTDNVKHMSLSSLCAAYIASQQANVAPQTALSDKRALNAIIDILGEDTDINTIDARMIIERLDATGEPPKRKNYRLRNIKKLFRWAYRMDYIEDVGFLDKIVKYKDDERSRRSGKYIEPDELPLVLDAMDKKKYRQITEFLALTGLRIGEALALTADDFDMETRTISINKTFSLVTHETGTTKTPASTRTIYIQNELLPLVDEILPECFQKIDYNSYNNYLKRITKETIGRSLSTHAMRHTHTSLLATAGLPLELISRRLGHQDLKITTEIYLHITSEMKHRDAALLDAVRLMKPTI